MRIGRARAVAAGTLVLVIAAVWVVFSFRVQAPPSPASTDGAHAPFRLSADGELVRPVPVDTADLDGAEAASHAAPLWVVTPDLARERRRLQDRVLALRSPSSMGVLLQEVGLEVGRRASRCLASHGWSLDRILDDDEKVLLLLDLADDGVHAAFRWVEPDADPPAPEVRACLAPLVDGLALPWRPEPDELGTFFLLTPTLLTGQFRE